MPLLKSGKKEEMDNYRPISILPAVSKIAEKAVYYQLYQHLDQNVLLSQYQSGFRKNFSTGTAVTFFVDNICRNMDNGLLTGAIYMDLKKAFDTIDHNLLLTKLPRYGGGNQTLKWFSSYLRARFQRVEIDGNLSTPAEIQSGVPQGLIVGPLLFIMYINDLPSSVHLSRVMLYADDTVLYYAAKSAAELEIALGLDLNNVASWMKEDKLFLNTDKTEYVIYGTRQNIRIHDDVVISYNETPLKRSTSFKYVGVYIDQYLSFNIHINHIMAKVSKRLGLFRCIRGSISIGVAERLYKAMLLIFDYCDVVWERCGQVNSDALERAQRRAAKLIFPNSGLDTDTLLESLSLELLTKRREAHSAILAKKCLGGPVLPYLKGYFKINESIHSYGTRDAKTKYIYQKLSLKLPEGLFIIQEQ